MNPSDSSLKMIDSRFRGNDIKERGNDIKGVGMTEGLKLTIFTCK